MLGICFVDRQQVRPGGSRGSMQGSLGGVEPGAEEGEVGQGKVGKGKVGGQEVVTEKEQEQGKEQERGKGEMSKYLYPGPVSVSEAGKSRWYLEN